MTLRPDPPHMEWALVGIALDYRIRYYFAVTPPEELIAAQGAMLLAGQITSDPVDLNADWESARRTWDEFAGCLHPAPMGVDPVGHRLPEADERALCRACYALACYETLFRAVARPDWPIVTVGQRGTVDDLLALGSDAVTTDLTRLSRAFHDTQGDLLGQPATLNPMFGDVSGKLGGADADLIVGDRLIDIKTSVNPAPGPTDPYQLLGYALADTDDRYGIRGVGFYYSRRPTLVQWSLQEYCDSLAGKPTDIEATRRDFHALVGGL
ncbi:MAG: hypothetical protein ACRENX_01245 [Candidatus Dormibacteria bacterium]